MKLLSQTALDYLFETSNGGTFTRQILKPSNISLEIQGWKSWRALYDIPLDMIDLFPHATHMIELSPFRSQDDPLFIACPCHIKEGTKHQLMIYEDDDREPTQVKVIKIHNWV